jgi:hypothetical protein
VSEGALQEVAIAESVTEPTFKVSRFP